MEHTNATQEGNMVGSESRDALTGLLGKEACMDALAAAVGNGTVSLAFFDIDQFLHVNQEFGRDAGDSVLRVVGRLMQELFPGTGEEVFRDSRLLSSEQSESEAEGGRKACAYRNGGDEFAVVMPGVEKEQAFLRLEAARSAFAENESLSGITPHPTVSMGVATYPDDGETRQELIRKADDALYRAKTTGRNKVVLAREEKKIPKTSHYTQGQLERLSVLAKKEAVGEAELLREALDDLLKKYSS